ncbi:hypothetical protein [Lutibacter sp. HS1-25]|uniref:hypothetical protein n=1 Tax=Lutibacter sp. HS1-25 TaxID=2485000 RepID=UPI00101217AA|nr:hypothetical protein [Lutibacter sp. HS1-25]
MLQTFLFGSPFYFALTLGIRLITIYFTVKLIGQDFVKIFIQSIKIISIVSLAIWLFQTFGGYGVLMTIASKFNNLGVEANDVLVLNRPSFIIYTIQTLDKGQLFVRNSGPFWEPGLFALYLNIVLFINLFINKKIFDKTNLLFIICIVTSFSTMGFVTLILNLTFVALLNKAVSLPKRIFMITFLIVSVPIIFSLPFMHDKIEENYSKSNLSYSRFGAAIVHWNIVQDFPYTGMPSGEELMSKFYSKYANNISPNGITAMFTKYGVFVGFFYYFLLYRCCLTIMELLGEKKKGYALFIILVVVLFSETQGDQPMYWAIIFSQFPLENYLVRWKQYKRIKLYNRYLENKRLSLAKI